MKLGKIKQASLSEIGHGPIEVKFALIDPKTGDTLTPFCKCKDYFTDVFWSNNTHNPARVYGFSWDPDQDKGILKNNRLFVAVRFLHRGTGLNPQKKAGELEPPTNKQIKGLTAFLHTFEKALNFEPAKIEMCDEGENIIIEFDKEWTEVPYLISAFFLFIRLGVVFTKGEKGPIEFFTGKPTKEWMSPSDSMYFNSAKKRIVDLLEGKIDKRQKFSQYTDGHSAHNRSGIVNYSEYKID